MSERKYTLRKGMVLVAFGVCLYVCLQNLNVVIGTAAHIWGIISPIALGLCIAFVLNVLMSNCEKLLARLTRKVGKINKRLLRVISLLLTLMLAFGFITLVLGVVIPNVSEAIGLFISNLPRSTQQLSAMLGSAMQNVGLPAESITSLQSSLSELAEQILDMIADQGSVIATYALDMTSSLLGTVTDVVFALIIAIYVLIDKERIGRFVHAAVCHFLPGKYAGRITELAHLSYETFSAFVCGQFLEAVILGSLCFVGMLIFRFPYAAVISLLIGVTALIPIVGAWIGCIVAALLVLTVSPIKALLMIVFILVLQQLEGNLIYPRVVGSSIGLPGVLVLSAVIVGQGLMGIVGILFAVPMTAILYTILREAIYGLKKA